MATQSDEIRPLLNSRGQVDPAAEASRRAAEGDDIPTDEENDEMVGTWGLKDKRGKGRKWVDNVGLGCVAAGLLLFLPLVQYIVLDTHAKTPGGLGWFVWHPTMQSLGITIAVLSIQSLQTSTAPAGSLEKARGYRQHKFLNLGLAFPFFLLGSSAIIYNKWSHGAKHFTSWHGKLGLAVLVWMMVQALVGGLAHYYAQSMGVRASKYYKYHRASGYLLLPLILVVAHLGGAYSDWVVGHSSLGMRIAAFDVGLALVAIGVVLRARTSKMRFI